MRGEKKSKLPRPDPEVVTLEWIDEQQLFHHITDYELSLQLCQQRSYLNKVRAGGIGITKGIKAAIWHYFRRLDSREKE